MSLLVYAFGALSAIEVANNLKNWLGGVEKRETDDVAKDFLKLGKDYIMRDSLISYTKVCRVEPITLVDERVIYQPYTADILQCANSLFAAYYLQAVAIDTTVGNVSVLQRLDKFNPERTALLYTLEDFKEGLPKFGLEASDQVEIEKLNYQRHRDNIKDQQRKEDHLIRENQRQADAAERRREREAGGPNVKRNFMTDSTKAITQQSNLVVGKVFDVNLRHNDQEFSIPVSVRLNVNNVDPSSFVHILGIGKDNKSMKSRYHKWRSGELEFFRDIVMCEDLVKAHRSTMIKDKSGTYTEILRRRSANSLIAAASGEISVGSASTLAIISDETRKELEYEVGGKLKDFRTRQRIFEDTYLMLLFVVDTEYEQVTIYHRGIELPTRLSVKEAKIASKNNGPDVGELLKSFIKGDAPSF